MSVITATFLRKTNGTRVWNLFDRTDAYRGYIARISDDRYGLTIDHLIIGQFPTLNAAKSVAGSIVTHRKDTPA